MGSLGRKAKAGANHTSAERQVAVSSESSPSCRGCDCDGCRLHDDGSPGILFVACLLLRRKGRDRRARGMTADSHRVRAVCMQVRIGKPRACESVPPPHGHPDTHIRSCRGSAVCCVAQAEGCRSAAADVGRGLLAVVRQKSLPIPRAAPVPSSIGQDHLKNQSLQRVESASWVGRARKEA